MVCVCAAKLQRNKHGWRKSNNTEAQCIIVFSLIIDVESSLGSGITRGLKVQFDPYDQVNGIG